MTGKAMVEKGGLKAGDKAVVYGHFASGRRAVRRRRGQGARRTPASRSTSW